MRRTIIALMVWASPFWAGAQTLTQTYVQLADSADYYMKHEQWPDAERVIVRALRHEPANKSNWLLWSNLGVVRTHRQDYAGALEAYDIGLASAPKSTVLLSNRAWTYLDQGKTKEALGDIDATLRLDSLQPWPLKMRGLLSMKNNPQGALSDLCSANLLSPGDAAVLAGIGDLEAADGRFKDALRHYEESLKYRNDEDVTFRFLLTMTEKGDFARAQELTVNALAKWPRNPALHLLRAMQHKRNYQHDSAEKEKNLALGYGADPLLVDRLLNIKGQDKTHN